MATFYLAMMRMPEHGQTNGHKNSHVHMCAQLHMHTQIAIC